MGAENLKGREGALFPATENYVLVLQSQNGEKGKWSKVGEKESLSSRDQMSTSFKHRHVE